MVELPQHVHRVTKRPKNGQPRVYTFYTRHRNTPQAWPSIALPSPLEGEFELRHSICVALQRDEQGFLLAGKRLPDVKSDGFWPAAEKAYKASVDRRHKDRKDFTALVDAFQNDGNPAWATLSKSTRRGYKAYGNIIKETWGDDLPRDLTTVIAQEAIDELGETPASANQFRAFLSRLIAWGIPRGYSESNPVEHTEKVPGGEPWSPWPEWAFEVLLEHAPIKLVLPAISALFTGQRQGDVVAMKRPRNGLIEVRAQKTKKTVWIPIHSEYQKWIEGAPKGDAVQLHLGATGQPFASADSFRTEWQKLMNKEAFKRFRDERIVFHGLRKNAVINLLEVGCTEAEVGSIVNMSEQMVRHYGRDVNVRALAKNGLKLLESRWTEVGPAALRNRNGT